MPGLLPTNVRGLPGRKGREPSRGCGGAIVRCEELDAYLQTEAPSVIVTLSGFDYACGTSPDGTYVLNYFGTNMGLPNCTPTHGHSWRYNDFSTLGACFGGQVVAIHFALRCLVASVQWSGHLIISNPFATS